jgi:hypothetical protein
VGDKVKGGIANKSLINLHVTGPRTKKSSNYTRHKHSTVAIQVHPCILNK